MRQVAWTPSPTTPTLLLATPTPPCPSSQAPKSWQWDCLTGADCTSFHLLFSLVLPWFSIHLQYKEGCHFKECHILFIKKINWSWKWPNIFETHLLAFVAKSLPTWKITVCIGWNLLLRVLMTVDIIWSGWAGRLLTTWEKSKQCNLCENAPTSLKDLSSCMKRHRGVFLLFLVRSTGDRLWTFEGGASLVSLSTWKETSSQTDSYTTTDWLLAPVFARDPLAAFPCLSSSVTDKNLPVCHSPDAPDQLNNGPRGGAQRIHLWEQVSLKRNLHW